MEAELLAWFKKNLNQQLEELLAKADSTIEGMGSAVTNFPDPTDRALYESSQTRDLRIREREKKLATKIREALSRIQNGTFGICEECGEEIDIERLKARPVTTLCIDCKRKQEELEKRKLR